jgi:NAD(P) transhydrogenase subunit alpha
MNIAIPKENHPDETRVALIPEHVAKLAASGAAISIEAGLGDSLQIEDDAYTAAGAVVVNDRRALLQNADMVLRIRKPTPEEASQLKKGSI